MKQLIDWIREKLFSAWGTVYFTVLNNSDFAIKVTNMIKVVVESKAVNAYVELSKNQVDDKTLLLIKKAVKQIGLALQLVKENESLEVAFDKVILYISNLPDYGKGIMLREISGAIAKARSEKSPAGKAISIGEFISIIQLMYKGSITK